jgi:hypothetical protein
MQLARHRGQIEAELQKGELSLRGARQLISAAQNDPDGDEGDGQNEGEPEQPEPEESLFDHWQRLSHSERAAGLDAIGVQGVLGAMSPAFGRDLRERVPAPRRKAGNPDKPFKATMLLERAGTDASGNPNYAHQPRAPSSRQ